MWLLSILNTCKKLYAEKEENSGRNDLTENKTLSREAENVSDRSHNSSQNRNPKNSVHEFFKGFRLVGSFSLHLTLEPQKYRGSLERGLRIRVKEKRDFGQLRSMREKER